MKTLQASLLMLIAFLSFGVVRAQSDPVCPADVLLALARSASTCYSAGRNQACYANGSVTAAFFNPIEGRGLGQPGDIVDLTHLSRVQTTTVNNGVSIATLLSQASLPDLEERSIVMMMLGDAEIINEVTPTPSIVVTAAGSLNIRQTPESDGEIMERRLIGETLIANGINADGDWLRVRVPNTESLGWVSADVVTADDPFSSLAVVDVDTPYHRPFRLFSIHSGEATFCDGALQSGVLLQTPNTFTDVALTINGIDFELSATAFLQADENTLTVDVLDGELDVLAPDGAVFVPAGTRTVITLATGEASPAAPYDTSILMGLPVNNLPGRMVMAEPLSLEGIEALLAERNAVETPEAPEAQAAAEDDSCQRVVTRPTTLWAGPGIFYEAINELQAGTRIVPLLQTTDADGEIWWQLRNSNWIRASRVEQTGDCEAIPVTDRIQPPRSNTLSLETCESRNGPLRVGQLVTIQFQPPAWNNYGEARDAVIVDPGVITIDSRRYPVRATEPIRLGTEGERYIRIFSTSWVATGGAHRIEAERLSYVAICDITVPFG